MDDINQNNKIMKTIIATFILCLAIGLNIQAQPGKGHGKGHGKEHGYGNPHNEMNKGYSRGSGSKKVIYDSRPRNFYYVKNKKYYKHKMPYWAPSGGFAHRHLFFPAYGCYYDTYTGYYIYKRRGVWVRTYAVPTFIVDIEDARYMELDDYDDTPNPQVYFGIHIKL